MANTKSAAFNFAALKLQLIAIASGAAIGVAVGQGLAPTNKSAKYIGLAAGSGAYLALMVIVMAATMITDAIVSQNR